MRKQKIYAVEIYFLYTKIKISFPSFGMQLLLE